VKRVRKFPAKTKAASSLKTCGNEFFRLVLTNAPDDNLGRLVGIVAVKGVDFQIRTMTRGEGVINILFLIVQGCLRWLCKVVNYPGYPIFTRVIRNLRG
jgi:hypothetical protein